MTERVPHLTTRLQGFGTTIFARMSALAAETGSVNLGQGFPDTEGPPEVLEAAVAALRSGDNQYPPGPGVAELRHAVAEHQARFYGLEYRPDDEVLVTTGATEAIAAAMLALCEVGDEVVTFEPYYDSYAATIAMAGAQRRVVTLRAPDWTYDPAAVEAAITPRTRLAPAQQPPQPDRQGVQRRRARVHLAELCVRHDLVAVTDEVYEHLVFDGAHLPLASRPGMRDRTVTISSGGKTFSFTGWKVGWICAPAPLVAAVRTAKQFLTYVNAAPFQRAVAVGLGLGDEYYAEFLAGMRARRDRLVEGLGAAGFDVRSPDGTYFATVDIRSVGADDGLAFCLDLPHRCGVVAVPSQVFYDDQEAGRPHVRFAFCKRLDVLDEAVERLAGVRW